MNFAPDSLYRSAPESIVIVFDARVPGGAEPLQRLPEWVTDEAEASAWDESWSMALRNYESRRSA